MIGLRGGEFKPNSANALFEAPGGQPAENESIEENKNESPANQSI
jgi:hypothetical protein